MQVMLYTGYFDYQTFSDGQNNAIENNARIFDISTDEKFRKVKVWFLKEKGADEVEYLYSQHVDNKMSTPPVEPKFSLSEMEDETFVKSEIKKYRDAIEQHSNLSEDLENVSTVLWKIEDHEDLRKEDYVIVDKVFDFLIQHEKTQESRYPSVYFVELEDLSK